MDIQEEYFNDKIVEKAIEMKRFKTIDIFLYGRKRNKYFRELDYYELFLITERKKELLDLLFNTKNEYKMSKYDIKNEQIFYFLIFYFF